MRIKYKKDIISVPVQAVAVMVIVIVGSKERTELRRHFSLLYLSKSIC
jgi:hypothetical protein